jgi:hypothetical protein
VEIICGTFRMEIKKPAVDIPILIRPESVKGFVHLTISITGNPDEEVLFSSSLLEFNLRSMEPDNAVIVKKLPQSVEIRLLSASPIKLTIEGKSPQSKKWTILSVISNGPILTIFALDSVIQNISVQPEEFFQLQSRGDVIGLWQNITVYPEMKRVEFKIELAKKLAEKGLIVDSIKMEIDQHMISPYVRAVWENGTEIISSKYSIIFDTSKRSPELVEIAATTPAVEGIELLTPISLTLFRANRIIGNISLPMYVMTGKASLVALNAELQRINNELKINNTMLQIKNAQLEAQIKSCESSYNSLSSFLQALGISVPIIVAIVGVFLRRKYKKITRERDKYKSELEELKKERERRRIEIER